MWRGTLPRWCPRDPRRVLREAFRTAGPRRAVRGHPSSSIGRQRDGADMGVWPTRYVGRSRAAISASEPAGLLDQTAFATAPQVPVIGCGAWPPRTQDPVGGSPLGVRLPPLAGLEAPMKVAVEEIESCKRRLVVEAPADVVTKEWERAYDRVQKQARLPGFRKGHVPRSLVKVHFADDVRREVAQHLIPDVYRQALSEVRLDPVGEPDLQDVRFEEGAPLTFTAIVEIKPDIALGDVKGVEVEHAQSEVTDDEVAAALEQMREQQAEFRAVDRAAHAGDLAVVDYTLRPDEHDPTTATGYHFILGSGAVMPEIDAAAAGMKAGDEKDVTLRFADDHRI